MSKRKIAAAIILAAYVCESSDDDDSDVQTFTQKRRISKKNWVKLRKTEGFCAKLMVELRAEEPQLYKNFIPMSAAQFGHLHDLVKPHIEKADTVMRISIPASTRLLLTLYFLVTGDSFRSLQYLFHIPQPTISCIIPEVLDAIYKVLVDDFLKVPKTEAEWEAVARQYNDMWQFPNCIGTVDGKHIVMAAPPNPDSVFYNYKGTHSIVLMGIADAEYKLLYVEVGCNGFSDGGVFNCSTFCQALDTNQLCLPPPKALPGRETLVPYVLLADDAFATRLNMMKPFPQRGLTMFQRVYNYRLSRARRVIENVFGIMSARFRVLRKPLLLDADKSKKVTLACCVLHNYLLTTNKEKYAPSSSVDQYDATGNLTASAEWRVDEINGTMLPLEPVRDRLADAKGIQKEFAAYFVDEGEVEWQYAQL